MNAFGQIGVIYMADVMIDEYLDEMDDILDKAQSFPLSSKKSLVDVEQLRECLDHIRMNLPNEVKQAKKIVSERKSIIDEANRQAEEIVTRAESRKNALISENEITRAAQARAAEIEKQALAKAKAVKSAADEYIISTFTKAEETLAASLTAIKRTKSTIKAPAAPNVPMNNIPPQR
ncbi:MAG: ATPase [Oscillospiraceae bacterium]|nr:ATPase [Oscillospiraceae bacterium]